MSLSVRVTNDAVIISENSYISIGWNTIEGKDGKEYQVKAEGTGKTTSEEICRFQKPFNGDGLPDEIKKQFEPNQLLFIQEKIDHKAKTLMGKRLTTVTKTLTELTTGMSVLDKDSEEITPFLIAIDAVKDLARKNKWKKRKVVDAAEGMEN